MSNAEKVQAIYAAFGRGDIPAILEQVAETVEWEHDAVDNGIPYIKPGKGRAHVVSFFETVGRDLEFKSFDVLNVLSGGNQVVGVVRIEAVYRPTGKTLSDYEGHLWTFSPEGKIVGFRHWADTARHVATTRK